MGCKTGHNVYQYIAQRLVSSYRDVLRRRVRAIATTGSASSVPHQYSQRKPVVAGSLEQAIKTQTSMSPLGCGKMRMGLQPQSNPDEPRARAIASNEPPRPGRG